MAQKILEFDPKAKILFMSGYSDAALEVQARKKFPFIRKPFLPADLIRKISEVLGPAGDVTTARRQHATCESARPPSGARYNSSFKPGAALANSRNSGRAALVRSKESFPNL